MSSAVAAALYFDHELAADPRPFVALVESLTAVGNSFRQSYLDTENRKMRPPTEFDLKRLVARITKGMTADVGVETALRTPDVDTLFVAVDTTPVAKRPERYALTKCRYEATVAIGAARFDNVDAIVNFADSVAARAGAIFVANTAEYARALATGGSGPTLTAAQNDRITDGLYWRPRWGDVIRGPEWGTFLGAPHVDRLGGLERIKRESGCARVIALSSGGAYLQTTPEPTDEVPEPLVRFLEPVRHT
jgi:hypothetical protein